MTTSASKTPAAKTAAKSAADKTAAVAEKTAAAAAKSDLPDLRQLLLQLYLQNNPQMSHSMFIYSYLGVVDSNTNPFHFVSGKLPPNVKKTIILQNIASGEMIQAFIVPNEEGYQIDNVVLYGNKTGMLTFIKLDGEKIAKTEKYRQFGMLTESLLHQFIPAA